MPLKQCLSLFHDDPATEKLPVSEAGCERCVLSAGDVRLAACCPLPFRRVSMNGAQTSQATSPIALCSVGYFLSTPQ
eukprot:scaffold235971_cov46-Prasinocladus_malaysianus.AAC.1